MRFKNIILTGDRPTGPLHLGHYVGSLQTRVEMEKDNHYEQFIMIADAQALTDNADNPEKVRQNVLEVALDYLAVGLDPKKSTIFIQSAIPELAELNLFFLNLVTLARLQRNPTVKNEMKQKGFGANVPAGFLTYPVSQAADITAFKGTVVPVGEDQLPILEQVNEIVRKFNSIYGNGKDVLLECKALLSNTARLSGIDGKAKASKSMNNAIFLSDSSALIKEKVMQMYTDSNHLKVSDPGKIKGNIVFEYLDAFDLDKDAVMEMKKHYQRGGLGDVACKKRLLSVLEEFLNPIRSKRESLEKNPDAVMEIIKEGTARARKKAKQTMSEVKTAMKIDYFTKK
ncbi:MAG: tryptophan--tRNA ligase [Patescibacteria group bacterium]|jgi:tryptophanyl-tRNA synthetase|nr:tryptophan--tRNA ligase [Patescibacteria group bacterium]